MKKLFTLLILVIFVAGSISGQYGPTTASRLPDKKAVNQISKNILNPPAPAGILQGGDVISTATAIPGLPYSDNGTTTGYTNDYDEACPYTGSTAPDVVYSYAPADDQSIDIDLCGTAYDSKLYVYENDVTTLIACNDDYYSDADCGYYTSALFGVDLIAGNTYYIIIDGYGTSSGSYILNVEQAIPCVWGVDIVCPSGAVQESEPCGLDMNGGCNMDAGTETWEPVPEAGVTVCGTMFADNALGGRDTDWFELILTQNAMVTLTADADQLIIFGLISGGTAGYGGNPDCATVTEISPNIYAGPCAQSSLDLGLMNPGTYWFFVGMTVYDGFPCTNNYWIDFEITPVSCLPPLSLLATDITMTSANLTWLPGETETSWEYVYGLAPLDEPTGPGTPSSSNTLNPIGPLTSGSSYQFYVRSNCDGNFSPWVGPADFNTLLCDPAEQCSYTFRMTDDYGDGWNGNTMDVIQGGITVQTLSLLSGAGPEDVPVPLCNGYNFELFWNTGGSYASEVGIEIIDPFGQSIYYKAPGVGSQGTSLYIGMTNCTPPECPMPTNLSASNPTLQGADLDWDYAVDSFFDIFIDLQGNPEPGPGSIPTVAGIPNSAYTWTEGAPGTGYNWWVRSDCGFNNPRVDYFWMAMTGGILDPLLSGATFDLDENEDGIWYNYTQSPDEIDWWNVWFYNDPPDPDRMKKIRMGFWIQPLNPDLPANLYYVVNWSTLGWTGTGFPTPDDEAYIERSPVNGPKTLQQGSQWIEFSYVIADYNPEWISVDIWGDNIQILEDGTPPPSSSPLYWYWNVGYPGGVIVHECLPKPTGNNSEWQGPGSFFTGYCIPAPTSVDGLGITNVAYSTVNNSSGAEPGNYGDYSALVGDVQPTTTIPVYITYQTGYTYDTKIWIDWNDDLDFNDAGEEVYSGTSLADNPTTLAASFDVPISAPQGNHRMRIGGVDSGPPTPCYTGPYGSFEDYTVNVIEPPTCLAPDNLTTLNITSGSAELSFDIPDVPPDSFFDVFYALDGVAPGGTEGTILTGVLPPVTIEDLDENTAYNWYARSVCGLDQPDIEHFWVGINELSQLVSGSSGGSTEVMDPGEDMTWYEYQDESGDFWYNIWFYNDPFDDTRMKIIKMGFWVQRLDPAVEGNIFYVVNWSAPGWNPDPPAFPMPEDEVYVERSPTNGPFPVIAADITNPYGQWIELTYTIPDYNPAWVSVDIWGDNIIILDDVVEPPMDSPLNFWWQQSPGPGGILVHECLPKPSGNSSPWEGPVVFTTLPQCPVPTNLAANNITTTSAELSWNGPVDSFFDVFFDPGSEPFFGTPILSVTSPLQLNDLEPGTDYSFSVRTDCGFDAPKIDYFWMAMAEEGILLDFPMSGGTADDMEEGEDGTWYLYNQAPGGDYWWNIWFYNDSVDVDRMKKIRMGFWVQSLDGANIGILNYVINWSDTAWDGPGFPTPLDEAFIHRSPVNGPMDIAPGAPIWVELYYIIPDYNPEWVSVDIWGENIQILQLAPQAPPAGSPLAQYWVPGSPGGIIVHECLPRNSGPTSEWSVPISFTTLCPAVFNLPLCQSFDDLGPDLANCWTEQLEGLIISSHWSVLATNNAGGLPNEAYASFSPGEGETQADNDRLVSPALNTTGMTSINVSFKQYLDDFNAGVNDVWIKLQSSSDGLAWTDEWVYAGGLGLDIPAEIRNLAITNNVGSTTYIAWTLSGNTYDINSWHVDDICIYESCMMNTWTGSKNTEWNDPDNWSCGILPNNQTTVVIPAGLTNYPIVTSGITAYCFDVDLAPGATLTVENGAVLNVVNP